MEISSLKGLQVEATLPVSPGTSARDHLPCEDVHLVPCTLSTPADGEKRLLGNSRVQQHHRRLRVDGSFVRPFLDFKTKKPWGVMLGQSPNRLVGLQVPRAETFTIFALNAQGPGGRSAERLESPAQGHLWNSSCKAQGQAGLTPGAPQTWSRNQGAQRSLRQQRGQELLACFVQAHPCHGERHEISSWKLPTKILQWNIYQ
mmetsp:Transcript_50951/g.111089  ORF Transcript_50951/g.111089 Transcript_50951/m.111089 type:complete len:202 (-) Transcript_50951:81-686(-)